MLLLGFLLGRGKCLGCLLLIIAAIILFAIIGTMQQQNGPAMVPGVVGAVLSLRCAGLPLRLSLMLG
jgi:hypothetical protein